MGGLGWASAPLRELPASLLALALCAARPVLSAANVMAAIPGDVAGIVSILLEVAEGDAAKHALSKANVMAAIPATCRQDGGDPR
jgi:hypothetical protein